jgi:hypothetical protein
MRIDLYTKTILSPDSAMRHQSGTFYFAQRGTSHVAATELSQSLTLLGQEVHNARLPPRRQE